MLSITQITNPTLEISRVVLMDHVTAGDDLCVAANRSPFSRAIDEGDVDLGVGLEVVGLA
jgi:hypothetical protein